MRAASDFNGHYRQLTIGKKVMGVAKGVLGRPGVPVTPLCQPFLKQTTYNIPWRKRHDDIV